MTKEELEKDYYADRPTEPYSDDDSPNDWANIAHYAEENLEKAFKRIAELEKENAELKGEADSILNNWCKGRKYYLRGLNMKDEEFEKITKLVETKNELIRKITNISFYKTEESYIFPNIGNALYDEENGKEPESAFASVCV